MAFPSSDVIRTATRYYETAAVAATIETLRPDLADRVLLPDTGPIAIQIDVGRNQGVVLAQVSHQSVIAWTLVSPYASDESSPRWPLGTNHHILATAAIAHFDAISST